MIPVKDTIPRRGMPVVTLSLIAINAVIFLFELSLSPDDQEALFYLFGVVPARCGTAASLASRTGTSRR